VFDASLRGVCQTQPHGCRRFGPLTRYAPTENGSTTSIGLGLFIARAVVVAHGGTITVSSSDECGTTFEVRLPRVG